MRDVFECFLVALRLGVTSFGGPVAHLGYFRDEYVVRRQWLSEERFGELMALTQFIPGPGSSQLGAAIGNERAGLLGGFAAWLGFTLPSALVMILVSFGVEIMPGGMIHGMKLVAMAVVALAWMGMRKSLATGWKKGGIALLALGVLFFSSAAWMTILVIAMSAGLGVLFLTSDSLPSPEKVKGKERGGALAVGLFAILLLVSYRADLTHDWKALAGIYHAGALVFGGGHVVLPMLQSAMVPDFMEKDIFLGGYGAAQAVPGPLFTFGAFLGGQAGVFGNSWLGAAAAIGAVFLPGMLLLAGTLSVWGRLRSRGWAQRMIQGANAAVVGVLGLALIQMATTGSVSGWRDAVAVGALFLILQRKLLPTWAVVMLAAGGGAFFH